MNMINFQIQIFLLALTGFVLGKRKVLDARTRGHLTDLILMAALPCSIIDSKGAFSGKKNFFLIMVISKSEVKKAVKMVKERDPLAFMTIVDINQVYGRFYIKPIE